MDQQSTGEEKAKVSRSKARHLRRKRLAAARRTAEDSSVSIQANREQNSGFQDPDNILSKSKARRLRRKKKAEVLAKGSELLLKTDKHSTESGNKTELVIRSQSLTNVSEYCNSDLENSDHIQKDSDSKDLPQCTSPDVITRNDIKSNPTKDSSNSFFKAELRKNSLESNENSKAFESNQSLSESQSHSKLTSGALIPNFKSNQLSQNTEIIREKDDVTSDDDLESPSSDSSSNLVDQYEINAIQAHDSLDFISKTLKAVLNTTELIENEKNLKISSNSHSGFQSNATVIDLTTYSSSDLIINTDSTSRMLEEQQIILDFISDSSSDLLENNIPFYTDSPEARDEKKIHKTSVTENLVTSSKNRSSFTIIKDYSLPSTSVDNSNSTVDANLKNSVGYKSTEDSNFDNAFHESEGKMSSAEKTREQIKAEREAKKAAKALAKGKAKTPKSEEKTDAKSGKDTPIKSGSSGQAQKDIKQNVVVKNETVPPKEKTVTTEAGKAQDKDSKENESQGKTDGKSKRESKAERRAKQEAQRAAKEKLATEKNKPKSALPPEWKPSSKITDPLKMVTRKTLVDNNLHEVKLFKHLYHERELSLVNSPTLNSNIHPAILRLGVQYASKVIIGSNARCVALLAAVKQLVQDFERPSQADFTRGLEASLQECAAYLHHCRPMAVSMQNALKHLKWQMTQLPTTVSDNEAKSKLEDAIDTYIREQILLAGKAISNTIQTKISNGDVILTYAFSSLIHKILIDAHMAGKQFRVIVVDGRPWLEGKEQLRRLAKHGIECSYILINALSFIMPEVSKVFLGAHAILANGAVMSRAGTAQVALMAKAFNVPVLVACETHKSCERVQTDSFVYNEIGDADELARNLFSDSKRSLLVNWKTKKSLDLLNITFDVTPADLVSAVVTELAILPCTSIPVILRIKPSEI